MPECRAVKFEIFGRLIRTGSKWGVKLPYKRIKRQIVNVFWQKKARVVVRQVFFFPLF